MATKITNISSTSTGIDGVPVRIRFQGEQFKAPVQLQNELTGAAIDITGQTITANCHFYTAQTTETGSGDEITFQIHDGTIMPTSLPGKDVQVNITNAAQGMIEYVIPADFYTEEIAYGESRNTPFTVIYFYKTDPTTTPPTILKTRRIIVFRRGGP